MKNNIFKQHLGAVAFYLLSAIIFTHPAILKFTTHIIGDGGDTLEYYSYILAFKNSVLRAEVPLWFTSVFRYPVGVNLSLTEGRIFVLIGGMLSLFINSVVVYNALIWTSFVLNGYISFLFYRKFTTKPLLAILGGFINGFSYWTLINAFGSISVLLMFGFPLLGLATLRAYKRRLGFPNPYLIGLAFYVLALCNTVQFIIGVFCVFVTVLLCLIFFHQKFIFMFKEIKYNLTHVIAAAIFTVLLYSLTFPYHIVRLFGGGLTMGTFFAAPKVPPTALFIPPASIYTSIIPFWLNLRGVKFPEITWWYSSLYIGLAVFLLLGVSLFNLQKSNTLKLLFSSSLIYLLFMLIGYTYIPTQMPGLPTWFLYPLYYFTNNYHYFIMPFWFFAAGAIVLVLDIIHTKKSTIIILLMILFIERVNVGFPITDINYIRGLSYTKIIRGLQGNAVLDIPLDVFSSYNILPFEYNKPIVGGLVHWYGDGEKERYLLNKPEIARFSCDPYSFQDPQPARISPFDLGKTQSINRSLISLLRQKGIQIIVIHKRWFYEEKCRFMREQAAGIFTDMSKEEAQVSEYVFSLIHSSTNLVGDDVLKRVYTNKDVFIYQIKMD